MRGVPRWRWVRAAAAVVAGAALAVVAAASAEAQNRGSVRGAEMGGFGRLLLTMQEAAKPTVSVSSGVLVITFDKPVDINPEALPNQLPNYVSAVRPDPDGSGLRLALARPVRPHLKEAGERIFLDLLPLTWTGEPPSLPQDVIDELARRAVEAEEALRKVVGRPPSEEIRAMPIRVATTAGFTRVILEMPTPTVTEFKREGERAEIKFGAAFRVDTTRLKAQLGDAVKSVEASAGGGASRVAIVLPDNVDAHGFREDDTFVVDIVPAEGKANRAAQAAPAPPKEAPAAAPKEAEPKEPAPKEAPKPAAGEKDRAAPPPTKNVEAAVAPPAQPIKRDPVKPIVTRDGDTIRIALNFAGRPPAAAFERHGVVTILFETEQGLEFAETPREILDAGGSWEMAQVGGARLLRLAFKEPRLVRLAPNGEGWMATLGDRLAAASEPTAPTRVLDDSGRTIVNVPMERVSRVHWIDDPQTGERLAVAPAPAPLRSVAKSYRFPEFELSPTAHGVAVVALADDLVVRSGVDEVTIERGSGLAVSPRSDRGRQPASGSDPIPVVFDRAIWDEAQKGPALERVRALQHAIADAQRNRRTALRLELARLLFARDLQQEARGALETIFIDQPEMQRDRSILLTRLGIVATMGRTVEARQLLGDELLREDPEAHLWRAVVDAQQRNWPRAAAGFAAGETIMDAYPEALQAMMRLSWARAAVEVRDFGSALAQIDVLERPVGRGFVRANEVAILRARVDEGQGRMEDAMAAYRRLYDDAERPVAAEAGLRGALLGIADKSMPREEAVAQLETVAATWRGGVSGVEADAIASLGRLYAEDQRWREAFSTARRGNELYPNDDRIRAVHDQAASLFETLFIDGKGDTIDRVEALALFYDFKDLTPPGRRGDDIVRRLAERLVELDLLESAAELLQHQIENRATGVQRATLAARLAVIYLMSRKPAAALAALKSTRLPELPFPIRRARNLLEARALSDLSRTDLALEMAAQETGDDVDRLTADIQWRGGRWRGAGETYERILGDRWKNRDDLSERERADIVRAAIAYSLGEELLSLDRLRGKYGSLMARTADARAFQVTTSPSAARAREFRELAQQVARGDTLADFLAEYRKRYPDIPPGTPRRAAPATTTAEPAAAPPQPAAPPAAQPQRQG